MRYQGSYEAKSMTSEYIISLGELSTLEEDEPDDDFFMPVPPEDLFYAKSAVDEVLSYYEMKASAVPDGIVLHEAKLIGPTLVEELQEAITRVWQDAQARNANSDNQ